MAHSNSCRLFLKLATLSVRLICLLFFAGTGARVRPAVVAAPQALTVRVEPQPPLMRSVGRHEGLTLQWHRAVVSAY